MPDSKGRPNHIEDALVRMHPHQWFTWSNSKSKVYANLQLTSKYWVNGSAVSNPNSKPTEKQCTDKLKELQDAFDKKTTDKESGKTKLKNLGLTDDEINELMRK